MLTTQIGLKQLLIGVTIIITSSLCLQAHAKDNPDFSDYRLQKVVAKSDKQIIPGQQQPIQNQNKASDVKSSKPVIKTANSDSTSNMPFVILALGMTGFVFLLFAPSWFSRNNTVAKGQTKAVDNIDSAYVAEPENEYISMIEAEAEIEHQLDVEEELDSFDRNTLGRMGARDRKHNNRVATKRKR
jgi:hypothetical protein